MEKGVSLFSLKGLPLMTD